MLTWILTLLTLGALPIPPDEERPDLMAMAAELAARSSQKAPAVDPMVGEFAKLAIKVPLYCREYHIWTGAPWGAQMPDNPLGQHWQGLNRFRVWNPTVTLDEFVPGLAWRRWVQTTGYPFLGPYDASQREIIRWQLMTAKAAGIKTLHVHLWASLWDDGADFTPLPIFERVLEEAAKLNYPVGVHDEIAFRRPPITRAQQIESCVRRTATLVKRYGQHPGWAKRQGQPEYYFQNWGKWVSPENIEKWTAAVEAQAGKVWWMLEMGPDETYWKIPAIRTVLGPNNSGFIHKEPYGAGPHPWDTLAEELRGARDMARRLGKEFGVLVYTRFNDHNDRGKPGRTRIDAEEGEFFRKGLAQALSVNPDFIMATQWNDLEESGFIEPGWDFDGFRGDPYRWCRFTAAAVGQVFAPAPLPARLCVDPALRRRVFGDSQKGDLGPVFHNPKISGRTLAVNWAEGSLPPVAMAFSQKSLMKWETEDGPWGSLRLANGSVGTPGRLVSNQEFRYYAARAPEGNNGEGVKLRTLFLAVRARVAPGNDLKVLWRSWPEVARVDSVWKPRQLNLGRAARISMGGGAKIFWARLEHTAFSGSEGDLTLSLTGKKEESWVDGVYLCDPGRVDGSVLISTPKGNTEILPGISLEEFFVAWGADALGNPGLPRPFYQGKSLPMPSWDF